MTDKSTEEGNRRVEDAAAELIGDKRREDEERDGQAEGPSKKAVDTTADTLSDRRKDEEPG